MYPAPIPTQYSICGKTRGGVSNVFLTIFLGVNENLGGLRGTRQGVKPQPPDKSSTVPT